MDDFLFHPEKLAGYPLTLVEARQLLNRARFDLQEWIKLDPDEVRQGWEQSQLYVWWKLATGDLHSFTQSRDSGTWYRLPVGYWIDHRNGIEGLAAVAMEAELRGIVEAKPYIRSLPSELIGQPILVWRDDVEKLVAQLRDEGKAYASLLDDAAASKSPEVAPSKGGDQSEQPLGVGSSARDEARRIAAVLDARNQSKRTVALTDVLAVWNKHGSEPLLKAVQSFMKGQPKGRRRRDEAKCK